MFKKKKRWSPTTLSSVPRSFGHVGRLGAFWYYQALDSPITLLALFTDHIHPRFAKLGSTSREEFNRVLAPFWDFGATQFVSAKVREQQRYSLQIREIFLAAAAPAESCDENSAPEEKPQNGETTTTIE
ncbi:hypothetical protein CONLIGDRAFT_638737 [Coniochaeta ligniaria NRRL 30616]|uniref:Uncharacterized protein n=1 Tax=Coniochaeta ligniaria NRRL 30616 TaxID=1408157 RepID=A0A1J7J4I8_9PEZI|nr:hypothetical protein CONLIGDRAFT_638737 [Coniochaeta ligniaria NRRL 30616]